MIFDAIKNQKCLVTVSGAQSDTVASLIDPSWTERPVVDLILNDGGWITFNFINPVDFQNATIQYTGAPNQIILQGSFDGFAWYELGIRQGQWYTFDDDNGPIHDGNTAYPMFRLSVDTPAAVRITELTLNGNHELSDVVERFVTPSTATLWPQKYFETYPFFPSTLKTFVKMLEGDVSQLTWPYGTPSIQSNTFVCDGLTGPGISYTWESASQVYSSNDPTSLIPDPIRCVVRDKAGRIFEAVV